MKKTILSVLISSILNLIIIFSAYSGEHIIQPKVGLVKWSDNNNHSVLNNTFSTSNKIEASIGFMYLYRLDNGFSFGAEIYGYEKKFTHNNGNTGDMDVGHVYAIVEYYFNNTGSIKPFIGIGVGVAGAELNGALNQEAGGFSIEFNAGVEFEFNDRFSLSTEFKHFQVDMDEEDDGGQADIKSTGYGLFAGFSIKF